MVFSRIQRFGQVGLSLLIGLVIWEAVGWQFNRAFFAPVLGSDVAWTNAMAHWVAGLFGNTITEPHPGTLPRLVQFFGFGYVADAYRELQAQGGTVLWSALRALEQSDFVRALTESLKLFVTGLGLALSVGVVLGMAMARLPNLRIALEHYIFGLYATPMAALIPFILAIFGFMFWPKVLVVFLFAVFPILYNSLEGARSLKNEYLEVAHAFRTSELRLWTDVIIPYTLPFALTGLRQSIGRALVGMVAAEILLNPTGLGGWLMDSSRAFDMAGILAAVVCVTVMGTVLMGSVRLIENRFTKWRSNTR